MSLNALNAGLHRVKASDQTRFAAGGVVAMNEALFRGAVDFGNRELDMLFRHGLVAVGNREPGLFHERAHTRAVHAVASVSLFILSHSLDRRLCIRQGRSSHMTQCTHAVAESDYTLVGRFCPIRHNAVGEGVQRKGAKSTKDEKEERRNHKK